MIGQRLALKPGAGVLLQLSAVDFSSRMRTSLFLPRRRYRAVDTITAALAAVQGESYR